MNPAPELLRFLIVTGLSASLAMGLAWAAAGLLRRATAAVRHALWTFAFVAVLVVMAGFWAPSMIQLDLLPYPSFEETTAPATDYAAPVAVPELDLSIFPIKHREPGAAEDAPPFGFLIGLWLLGFAYVFGRFVYGLTRAYGLAQSGEPPAESRLSQMARQIGAQLGLRREPSLRQCDAAVSPMTWGVWRPVVLLPEEAQTWSDERLRMTLTHELAHVARRDFWALPLVQFLCAVYWFNPLIWVSRRALVREREQACDDWVIALGAKASDYADHLLDMARRLQTRSALQPVALSMSRISELEGRLLAILRAGRRRVRLPGAAALLMAAFTLGVSLPLAFTSPWRSAHPEDLRARSADPPELSSGDLRTLAEQGIEQTYVQTLVDFGYRELTIDQIVSLHEIAKKPEELRNLIAQSLKPLYPVEDRRHICMRADQALKKPNIAVEIDGKTYYGLPHCTAMMMSSPSFLFAVDPYSGKPVDKAVAIAGATENGAHVFYFESLENLRRFNEQE